MVWQLPQCKRKTCDSLLGERGECSVLAGLPQLDQDKQSRRSPLIGRIVRLDPPRHRRAVRCRRRDLADTRTWMPRRSSTSKRRDSWRCRQRGRRGEDSVASRSGALLCVCVPMHVYFMGLLQGSRGQSISQSDS